MSYSAIMVVFQPTRPLRGATGIPFGRIAGLVFQPTRPLRGATMDFCNNYRYIQISTHAPLAGRDVELLPLTTSKEEFQPTRPLRGATLRFVLVTSSFSYFNPRAPCGARRFLSLPNFLVPKFQPTRPLRGATAWSAGQDNTQIISTHAPLAGRDIQSLKVHRSQRNFNPRAPCGARHQHTEHNSTKTEFQPTRPLRGATAKVYKSLCTFLR